MKRAAELLINGGEIFVIGCKGNGSTKIENMTKRVEDFNSENEGVWSIESYLNQNEIDRINANHKFFQTSGEPTKPTLGYTLKFLSND